MPATRVISLLILLISSGALAKLNAGQEPTAATEPEPTEVRETPGFGKFIGRVSAIWLREGDTAWDPTKAFWQMRLLKPFEYVDEQGTHWPAPPDSYIDGASIPEVLWGKVNGSPYTGHFREASVIHDRFCDFQAGHTFKEIHRMFYAAMRCEGCGLFEAKIKYFAVSTAGPQDAPDPGSADVVPFLATVPLPTENLGFQNSVRLLSPVARETRVKNVYHTLSTTASAAALHFSLPISATSGVRILPPQSDARPTPPPRIPPRVRAAPGPETYNQITAPVTAGTTVRSQAVVDAVQVIANKAETISLDEIDVLAARARAK